VEVTRGNLRHLIDWHNSFFQVTAADRATMLLNVGFDASVQEIWPYLCAGATLVIPEPEIVREPEMLRDWASQMKITIMAAPTLLAEVLMTSQWPATASLRCMLSGGDALRVSPPHGSSFRVFNVYGPAECTVVSTAGEVPPSDSRQKTPSIGYAITGAQVSLLDEDLREVPAGNSGEICISGAGVARGYLNQPQLTAQRFVIRMEDGIRMYRTGDLGRLNDDGSIQFLGRMDEQVKVRGYRIECGEIEAALSSLPEIQTSVVVLREQSGGHKGLSAYVVPQPSAELWRDQLRDQLRVLLPEYMIPEQFVRLSSMPTNENGKISRQRLPLITEDMVIGSRERPSSPVEAELMAILKKLLKVNQVELNDDFFLLGGHSFIANQLIARIRDHFSVELSLRAVFDNPTPAGMAHQIEQRLAAKLSTR
jgi:acyl-coenzyme A synthetase/AMP-(fatty) acid ligase/acyl carrier protein